MLQNNIKKSYYSPGKLLLTGEYFVLDGAHALAVPIKVGQKLDCTEIYDGKSNIVWCAYHQQKLWLTATIDHQKWTVLETNLPEAANFVLNTLKIIQEKTSKFKKTKSYLFETQLEFPSCYGLGSSSTLMANLANWAEMNPYALNDLALGGSGYDIAVALEKTPILYYLKEGKPQVEKISLAFPFKDNLLFVYLGKKQNSREGIHLYRSKEKSEYVLSSVSELTHSVMRANTLEVFSEIMEAHEKIVSQFLGISTIKEKFFSDCPAFIKSLGAWGGDFVLTQKFDGYEKYFPEKGYDVFHTWEELIGC